MSGLLPDGSYDAIVVDATAEPSADPPVVHLVLTLLDGEHKGDVVDVAATGVTADELDLLATPATLHVEAGHPRVTFD